MAKKSVSEDNIDEEEEITTNISTNIQNQAKILIIDDERLLRQSMKKILDKTGFYCETAFDYASAKKSVEMLKYDMIIADIVLPKMNGLELIKKLQEEFDITAAIIFITGEPNMETCVKAIRLGAVNYLEKPVNRSVLIEAIKQALIKRNYNIEIFAKDSKKTITLNQSFIAPQGLDLGDETKEKLNNNIEEMHKALLALKKKYGKDFNEEQRTLLNTIAQGNSYLRKTINEMEL